MMWFGRLTILIAAALARSETPPSSAASKPPAHHPPVAPSVEAATRNAFPIFNAVSAAMRQWGSSIHHNGMSFFLATVPQGSLFYHGTNRSDRFAGPEWLAFEVEHAQVFAESRPPPGAGGPTDRRHPGNDDVLTRQHPISRDDRHAHQPIHPALFSALRQPRLVDDDDPEEPARGYLHTYRAARRLNLLYLDGMAAGKASFGTLDAQDYVLLDWEIPAGGRPQRGRGALFDERRRADELCRLAYEWAWDGGRIDGFVRAEAGFEIIYCHFEPGGGLDLVSAGGSPLRNETGWMDRVAVAFEWIRACTLRYHGFPAGRIDVDWSSMVSAFFYDVNLTNPDAARPELPRVLNTTRDERRAVRSRVGEVVALRHARQRQPVPPSVDWQSIADSIVTRYADRLELLASGTLDAEDTRAELYVLLSPFMDFGAGGRPDISKCRTRYLEPAIDARRAGSWTPEDALIYAAFEAVHGHICATMIRGWEVARTDGDDTVKRVVDVVRPLVAQLAWAVWKKCGTCASLSEVCFIAMFPAGNRDDHYSPQCKDRVAIIEGSRDSYWR